MNRTVALVVLGVGAIVVLAGMGVLAFKDGSPVAAERFTRDALTILGVLAAAGGLVYQQSKVGEGVEQVRQQTNGTLSALMDENARLRDELAATREHLAAETAHVPDAPLTAAISTVEPPG